MELLKNEILFYKKVEVKMKIEKILKSIGLNFKIIDEIDNIKIIKIPTKLHICFIMQNGNQFILDRDTFDYLTANSLPYCLIMQDTTQNKYYFLQLEKESNWIKSCFASCDKEKIYLGKQVLNAQVEFEELKNKLSKYK